jgi:hypothetical protein
VVQQLCRPGLRVRRRHGPELARARGA